MIQLDALGPHGPYRARNRVALADVTGNPTAELSLVPPLFVHRGLAALRSAESPGTRERIAALVRAAHTFADGVVGGLTAAEHHYAISRVTGLPISVVRGATQAIACGLTEAYETALQARPAAALTGWRDPLTSRGSAVWTRRGDTFAVHAAGNHPAVHALWPQALAFGYRVAVRPSRREPFTPYRLITALHEAGFRHDQLMFLPTAHPGSADIIEGGDLALVYGGDDVVDRYRGRSDVLPQGPGRSKILLTKDGGWPGHLDTIVDAISSHGGRTCINASAVFVEGDPAPVAQAIAERLAALPSLPPEDEKAALPVQPAAAARRFEDYLREQAHGARSWLGADGVVDELGDGSAVLRPAVFQVADPAARQVGIEMPFPCVWVAPWSPAAGIGPLKNTLVLSVATRDERLIERLVREPTIRNVYAGDQPAYRPRPGLPHDGYLGEFLMRAKTVYRT